MSSDNMNVTASTSKDYTMAEFPKIYEEKTNEEQTDNDKVQKKFVLPPEYDENDSRWTLKYREPAPRLVELVEHSDVYVNADKLAECEKWSNDCKTFARMLLTEIFTASALSTCSWTSETTNASDIHGGQARPGLNEHAKIILQKYVVKYGQIRDWNRTDFQCIMKGIRQVMLEMRLVRQKEVEVRDSDKTYTPLRDKGFDKRQIVLPPEYDQKNSRWTLKYREYAPGLVELIEDSCVFIEPSQLAKFKRSSDDSITLARMLLNEIFTKSAMSTCSWNGPKAKDSDHDDSNGRLELDENAMVTLLKFVAEYELANEWIVTDEKQIERSIRQKLVLLKRVARKGEEAEDADKRRKKRLLYRMDAPPEYRCVDYETDTRWTLKYREPAPGLVELMDHSGVYVNADKLAEYKEKSNDCQALARMLLNEVFSTNALRICTLSRNNHELYNIPYRGRDSAYLLTLQPRPELDAYAEIILLHFVDEYALEKGWTILNFQLIRKSMMYEIHEIRKRYVDKVKESKEAAHRKKHEQCVLSQTVCPSNSCWHH